MPLLLDRDEVLAARSVLSACAEDVARIARPKRHPGQMVSAAQVAQIS